MFWNRPPAARVSSPRRAGPPRRRWSLERLEDRQLLTIVPVTPLANNSSSLSAVSADGRYVAFISTATNLVNGDFNGFQDVFLRDVQTGATTLVSTGIGAAANDNSGLVGVSSSRPSISADGRFVVFVSNASNLVSGDTHDHSDVFLWDRQTGKSTLVDTGLGGQAADGDAVAAAISGDGRFVTFVSAATNLVNSDLKGHTNVYLRDLQTQTTTLVSVGTGGAAGDGDSGLAPGIINPPVISSDGHYVAFQSSAANLVATDNGGHIDVFVRDTVAGTTTLLSTDSNGVQGNADSLVDSISGDGQRVLFHSQANNLIVGTTTTNLVDVFLRNRTAGTTTLVSLSTAGVSGNNSSIFGAISSDGRYVAFTSSATNLVTGDLNALPDVFLRDLQLGTTILISNSAAGVQGNGTSNADAISSDGRYVVFGSFATNLFPGDTLNFFHQYVWDALPFSQNFNSGTAGGFTEQSTGLFSVVNQRYEAAAGGNAVSTVDLGSLTAFQQSGLAVSATVNMTAKQGSRFSNGFIVFDFVDKNNYKLAGAEAFNGLWVIAQVSGGVYQRLATVKDTIAINQDHHLQLQILGNTASLYAENVLKVSATIINPLAGPLGLGAVNALTDFDDFSVDRLHSIVPATAPSINVLGGASVLIANGESTPDTMDGTDFGAQLVNVGLFNNQYTIKNVGTATLNLSGVTVGGVNASDFTATQPGLLSIAPGASTTFTIGFTPLAGGVRSAVVTVGNADPNANPFSFHVQGIGITAFVLQGNGNTIGNGDSTPSTSDDSDFGTAHTNVSAVNRTYTILNSSGVPLSIGSVSIGGAGAPDFVVIAQPSGNIPANGSTTFTIQFAPTVVGVETAQVTIPNGDGSANPFTFAIRGTGIAPVISVAAQNRTIANGDPSPSVTDSTDFGPAAVTGGVVEHSFTITNTGSGAVNLALNGAPVVAIGGLNAGDFTVTQIPSNSLVPGASTTLKISFDPSGAGLRTALVSIPTNDPVNKTFTFSVQGTGVGFIAVQGNGTTIANGDITPQLLDDTDFGPAVINSGTVVKTFTIQNGNAAQLDLTGTPLVAIDGTGKADFTVTALPSTPVAANGTTTFAITFKPSVVGDRSAAVTILNSDGSANPYSFNIKGTGTTAGTTLPFSQNFNQGNADGFTQQVGQFTLVGSAYQSTSGSNAVSTINLGDLSTLPPSGLSISTTLSMTAKQGNTVFSNGYIVFDYSDANNFKLAGAEAYNGKWVIAQVVDGVYQRLASTSASIAVNQAYALELQLLGSTATLFVGGVQQVSATVNNPLAGSVGLGAIKAQSTFDNVLVKTIV